MDYSDYAAAVHRQCLDNIKRASREGVIEGLERALGMNQAWDAVLWASAIRAEIERLRRGG